MEKEEIFPLAVGEKPERVFGLQGRWRVCGWLQRSMFGNLRKMREPLQKQNRDKLFQV